MSERNASVAYRVSVNNVYTFRFKGSLFLRQIYDCYDKARKVAESKGKANVWVKNKVVATYNIRCGWIERIPKVNHIEI